MCVFYVKSLYFNSNYQNSGVEYLLRHVLKQRFSNIRTQHRYIVSFIFHHWVSPQKLKRKILNRVIEHKGLYFSFVLFQEFRAGLKLLCNLNVTSAPCEVYCPFMAQSLKKPLILLSFELSMTVNFDSYKCILKKMSLRNISLFGWILAAENSPEVESLLFLPKNARLSSYNRLNCGKCRIIILVILDKSRLDFMQILARDLTQKMYKYLVFHKAEQDWVD